MYRTVVVLTLLLTPSVLVAHDANHSTQRARECLRVRDGYELELIASEPLIADPISTRLDRLRRLWVVEMPDYPNGPREGQGPSGRIKILTDTNADGVFDQATIFADQLLFATGVQPYRDGAIVTLAGKIVFMRDENGDGVSDHVSVWFEGFAEQNQQLRANHPILGPDGLVYVANGLRGGNVQAVDPRFDRRTAPVNLRDRDFCFDPDGGWWGAVTGKSQFGLTIDDFGRRIGCSNRNPAMLPVLSMETIDRDPRLVAQDAIHNVALAAEQSRVVARADAWTTSNLHSGQFSAACGVLAVGMEDQVGEWILACEPTAYLVQRQRMHVDGSVWVSRREDGNQEFLSSSDTWFRPVDTALGGGRSILITDMARAVIEHPDFMPEELKSRPDQWDGQNLGRIWRVQPKHDETQRSATLEHLSDAYRWLISASPWEREVAGQWLLESDATSQDSLRSVVQSTQSPRGRARAAWILQRRGWLREDDLSTLAESPVARLRALAVELARDTDHELQIASKCISDSEPRVVRSLVGVLASKDSEPQQRIEMMLRIAESASDPWTLREIGAMDRALLGRFAEATVKNDTIAPTLFGHLLYRLAIDEPSKATVLLVQRLSEIPASRQHEQLTFIESWMDGARRGRRSPIELIQQTSPTERRQFQDVLDAVGRRVFVSSLSPSLRARSLLIADATNQLPDKLETLAQADVPPEVRATAVPILLKRKRDWTRDYLTENLEEMSSALRSAAVSACGRTFDDTRWLLSKIADGTIPKTIIDPATANRLRRHANEEIRKLATDHLKSDPDRLAVLKRYGDAARQLGDERIGKKLFVQHCSSCHRIDAQGTNVGPDISDTRTKSADALLTSILDPNAAIDAAYAQYTVLTLDGRLFDGLLIDESAETVTLQQKRGERKVIARSDIEAIRSPGVSLMPEGFEQSISVLEMSHLLAYLKNWRYLKTPIPGTISQQTPE